MMAIETKSRGGGRCGNNVVEEAAYAGLQTVQKLVDLLSRHAGDQENEEAHTKCRQVADAAVTKFRTLIFLLGRTRTGHARFRRAPILLPIVNKLTAAGEGGEESVNVAVVEDSSGSRVYHPRPPLPPCHQIHREVSSFSSSYSLAGSLKRRCSSDGCWAVCEGRCHCSKRRKLKEKRMVRVPAVGMKIADIPQDDFSWRKYGQKPIKGSPHPRGYYKCSTERGCPARKHVERAVDDPTMMVVTYDCEHNHVLPSGVTSDEHPQSLLNCGITNAC